MRRKLLCGLAAGWVLHLGAASTHAQPVPARDLWDFPLGAVGEPAALATEAGVGLWNPAMMALPTSQRWRAGVASLSTGAEQGVEGQLVGVAWRRSSGLTVGLAVARSAVSGLVRTDTDPQSLGEIPYQSLLTSLTAAREVVPGVTVGVAARLREGQVDTERRRALAADLGVMLRPGRWQDARLAVGTFLWRPGREPEDRPLVSAAGDMRVLGSSPDAELRVGVAAQGSTRGLRERTTGELGPVVSGRFGLVEARAALPTVRSGTVRVTRARFSLGLQLSRFVVGLAREDANVGLGPLYQFTFSAFGT
jgi:hypothetical protein